MPITATASASIENAAHHLAETIKTSAEWQDFHRVNERFEKDEDLSVLLGEYQQLVAQAQGARSRGEEATAEMRRLEELQFAIQKSPLFQEREKAADAMLAVLARANAALTVNLGIDFAANARAQHGGGCCGGSGHDHGHGEGGGCGC